MRVGILQPCYLPWLGYFEQIQYVEQFVFLNDVQYTKEDWRNRNRIKTLRGPSWVTVPIKHASSGQMICEIEINYSKSWWNRHMNVFRENYGKAPYFSEIMDILAPRFNARPAYLQELTISLVQDLARYMGSETNFLRSSDLKISDTSRDERLIEICQKLKATELYDGATARKFLDVPRFEAVGIRVVFQNYQHPTYRQFFGPFLSHLSIVDLLFHHGKESKKIITSGHGTSDPQVT